MKRQIDNLSPGAVTGGNQSLALTREVNLDTLSSDSSEEQELSHDSIARLNCALPITKTISVIR